MFDRHNVFTIWLGPFEMSEQRKQAFLSIIDHVACPHVHINKNTLADWVYPGEPLHPLFDLLSATHQADYLRAYLMHFYGGGYTDIKHTHKNWNPFFASVAQTDAYCAGYPELRPTAVAQVGGALQLELEENYQKLIGVCSFIFRPRTRLSEEWMSLVHEAIERKRDELLRHPARHPQDQIGARFTDGTLSCYPFAWTELLGNILHPLILKYQEHVSYVDIAPDFYNYR